jgi:hypothetical protein
MPTRLQSLIDGNFISPLTLSIVLKCPVINVWKLLEGQAADDKLQLRANQLLEQYTMALRMVNAIQVRAVMLGEDT